MAILQSPLSKEPSVPALLVCTLPGFLAGVIASPIVLWFQQAKAGGVKRFKVIRTAVAVLYSLYAAGHIALGLVYRTPYLEQVAVSPDGKMQANLYAFSDLRSVEAVYVKPCSDWLNLHCDLACAGWYMTEIRWEGDHRLVVSVKSRDMMPPPKRVGDIAIVPVIDSKSDPK